MHSLPTLTFCRMFLFFSVLHDVVQVLLDNGADPLATGTAHLHSWTGYQPRSYPGQMILLNLPLSRGGFGAGDNIHSGNLKMHHF